MIHWGPLAPELHFGSNVWGVTLASLTDESVRRALRDILVRDGMLVFKDCMPGPEFHVSLSACFGPLLRHPAQEKWVEGYPELIGLTAEKEPIYELDDEVLAGYTPWHVDTIYTTNVSRGGVLRAVALPQRGGNTGFIDRVDAYNRLPEARRRQIEGLEVAYSNEPAAQLQPYPPNMRVKQHCDSEAHQMVRLRAAKDFPNVAHPLVCVQPETGRKILNLSPMFALHVVGMDAEESHELLSVLSLHITDESRAHFHHWSINDLVLWDNWRMLHRACGVPLGEHREMQRTTIAGEFELGRVLEAA